ncbi:hypothetical protein fHeYen901_113 [Yersinia phage fHe-Yen9-01]|uniref:Uncharacterized protein n=1 Tax=Yersinia phage fHe-Yen9-01 TaxID=1965363 RepID=A0A1V0DXK3_9CAUD|nr:hypothetical protein KNT60_gp112 [Yersinia phage fHe-Yen9-01]ARB05886.1 hypothetical protein fHeYen901_113 [Yersinia phage fHe-Yen9-01]
MAIKSASELEVGSTIFRVHGTNCVADIEKAVSKVVILSKPLLSQSGHLYINICIDYISCTDEEQSYIDKMFLNDFGITDGKPVYNLNRAFNTKDEALSFGEQCVLGVFEDPEDEEYYLKDKHHRENKRMMLAFNW